MGACLEPGGVIGGKYELVQLLGRGSMGEVWSARHLTLDELVAVKLMAPSNRTEAFEAPAPATARFRFEAQLAARLSRRSRHIVRVTDHGEDDGVAYLVMELLEGQTLESRLIRRPRLPLREVVDLVTQMGRALEVAHEEGIVHRDLKPANVFLARDEDGRILVKLLDFGIARTVHSRRLATRFSTADGLVFGTPGYMSPEQARAAMPDARCDLWALATVAYEALTGELPIPGVTTEQMFANLHACRVVPLHERAPELPRPLGAFFDRAFDPVVERRFASAADFTAAFAQAAWQEPAPVASFAHPTVPSMRTAWQMSARSLQALPGGEAIPVGAGGAAPAAVADASEPDDAPVSHERGPVSGTLRIESPPPVRPAIAAGWGWPAPRLLRPGVVAAIGLLVGSLGAATVSRARVARPGVTEKQLTSASAEAPSAPSPADARVSPATPLRARGASGSLASSATFVPNLGRLGNAARVLSASSSDATAALRPQERHVPGAAAAEALDAPAARDTTLTAAPGRPALSPHEPTPAPAGHDARTAPRMPRDRSDVL